MQRHAEIPINANYSARQAGWIVQLMPYTLINRLNPVFGYELRQLGINVGQFPRRSVMQVIYGMLFPLLLWGVVAVLSASTTQTMSNLYAAISGQIIIAFFGIVALNVLLMDSYTLRYAVSGLADHFEPRRWSLVILTTLPLRRIVLARYVIAQLRLWSSLCVIVGVRLGIAILLPLHILVLVSSDNVIPSTLPPVLRPDATYIQISIFALSYVVMALTLAFEPLWRLRTLSAVSVATAAYSRDTSARFSYGVFSVVGFSAIQWSIIVVMMLVYLLDFMRGVGFGALVVMFVPLLLYTVDQRMTQHWLLRAERYLLKLEF